MYIVEPTEVDEEFRQQVEEDTKIEEGESRLVASSENPAIFMREMLGVKPYAWQGRVLTDIGKAVAGKTEDKKFIIVTSRQIGKSSMLAVLALWSCIFNKAPYGIHNTTKVGSFSMSDSQSKKLMREIKSMMQSGDFHMREELPSSPRDFFTSLLDKTNVNNKTTVSFQNDNSRNQHELLFKDARVGPQIKTYPPTNSVLGETFSLGFIDEAMEVSDDFYDQVFTQTLNASNGVQVLTSTPYHQSGFFWEMIKNHEALGTNVYSFTIDAIKDEDATEQLKAVEESINGLKLRGKTEEIRKQYYAEFMKGANQFFDPDSVTDMFTSTLEKTKDFTKSVDVGIDFGGSSSSHTVITISHFNEDNDRIRRVWHKKYPIGEDLDILEDIQLIDDVFNVQRWIPEQCPQGDHIIKRMEKDLGLNTTVFNPSKEKVSKYSVLNNYLERGKVYSYPDEDLEEEMKALEQEETRTRTKIHAPPNYNDDMIDSFMMSCYFFLEQDFNETEIISYEPKPAKHRERRKLF